LTVALSALTRPQRVPVVLPRRYTVWLTAGVPADVMSCEPTAPGLAIVVLV
jgi:hypothetical protein